MENKFEIGYKYILFPEKWKEDVYTIVDINEFIRFSSETKSDLAYTEDQFYEFFKDIKRLKTKIKNTKLARKMYPQGEEKGEWLYV